MDLTWIAAGSLLVAGAGYALVRRARRFRPVWWWLICASLFALATRDLFRPRERGHSAGTSRSARDRPPDRPPDRASDRSAGERRSSLSPLVARLRRRFGRWLD